jgi:hypothetical protein
MEGKADNRADLRNLFALLFAKKKKKKCISCFLVVIDCLRTGKRRLEEMNGACHDNFFALVVHSRVYSYTLTYSSDSLL